MTRCCGKKFVPNIARSTWFKKTINFQLTLVSAERLPVIRRWSGRPMQVYAEVSLDGESIKKSNIVDMKGGTNPSWNFEVDYPIIESKLHNREVNLIVGMFCKRSVGRSLIGEVKICVKSLFDMGLKSENDLGYRVEGTLEGSLSIAYAFRLPNPLP